MRLKAVVPNLWAAVLYWSVAYSQLGRVCDWLVCMHAQPHSSEHRVGSGPHSYEYYGC